MALGFECDTCFQQYHHEDAADGESFECQSCGCKFVVKHDKSIEVPERYDESFEAPINASKEAVAHANRVAATEEERAATLKMANQTLSFVDVLIAIVTLDFKSLLKTSGRAIAKQQGHDLDLISIIRKNYRDKADE